MAKKKIKKYFEFKINKKYFPRNSGNKSKDFEKKQRDVLTKLHRLELDLESSRLKIKNIYAVLFNKKRLENRPFDNIYIDKLIREVYDFNYMYENYCLRVYIYRETLLHFVFSFLNIQEHGGFFNSLKDSRIMELNLDKKLMKFNEGRLKKIIDFRNKITHKLETEDTHEKIKMKSLFEEHKKISENVLRSLNDILKIKNEITEILINYKK